MRSGAWPLTSRSRRAVHARAAGELSTPARTITLASNTALTTIALLSNDVLRSRSIGRQIDLGRQLGKPIGDLVGSQFAQQGFVDELEHLRVQGPPVAPCAGTQSLVELLRNVSHVESRHIVMLAFC